MESEPIYSNYMSTKEAAELLGYTMQHTRFLIREGTLPGLKFGRDWIIERASVARYLGDIHTEENTSQAPAASNTSACYLPEVTPLQAVNVAQVPQRSPFRYPGGKTWLIPCIRQWLQSHQLPIHELIEPFAGGGIVSLTAVFEDLVARTTMVELDEDVAAVWSVILNGKGKWLADKITGFHPTDNALQSLFAEQDSSLEHQAFVTIVRNRIARGGIIAPGAGVVKNGENGKGLSSRWYPETLCRRILDIVGVKDRITALNCDGLAIMRENAHRPDCIWFIDPPYTVAGKRLYRYSEVDHGQLFEIASNLAGDFLMTYDNVAEIRYLADKHHLAYRLISMKTTHHTAKYELLIGKSFDWLSA